MDNLILKSELFENIDDLTKDFLNDYIFYKFKKEEFTSEELNEYIKDNIQYIGDLISESTDGSVTIRNNERFEWLKDNYFDYEDYIKEF